MQKQQDRDLLMNKFITSLCLIILLSGNASRAMDSKSVKLGLKLFEAARDGKLLKVKILLAFGANANEKNANGWTPLIVAAYAGHEAVCRLLIEKNAVVNVQDDKGITPLAYAANGHEAVCRLLIEKHANVDSRSNDRWTPLFFASYNGFEGACRLLIRRNATIDYRDNRGVSVLSYAVRHNLEAISKLLIDAQLGRPKAAAFTFLGIVRKRKKNLPCAMQYDVAKIIARMVFGAEVDQNAKQSVIAQINEASYSRIAYQLLQYVEQQINTRATQPAGAPQTNENVAIAAAPINLQPIHADNAASPSLARDHKVLPQAEVVSLLMRVVFLIFFYSVAC
jgi:hypothetical protein